MNTTITFKQLINANLMVFSRETLVNKESTSKDAINKPAFNKPLTSGLCTLDDPYMIPGCEPCG